MSKTILIITPTLMPHDAVSNDVMQLRSHLLSMQIKSEIYAQEVHPSLAQLVIGRHDLNVLVGNPRNILVYHHSILWMGGEEIVNSARCKIIFKYHNITPPSFFPFDSHRESITRLGREQTRRFVALEKISYFVGDSSFNTQELIEEGANPDKCRVIAPFHLIHDFDSVEINIPLQASLKPNSNHILFVGRVAPNKGHCHLIKTLARYIDFFGMNVHLHVIGGISGGDNPYLLEIESLIDKYKVGSHVNFYDKMSFQDLHTFYSSCSVFLVQSEHEGFCVPILEAQYHGLPVIAWGQCAVRDTVGEDQLVFNELDYDVFACALNRVFHNTALKTQLSLRGLQNFAVYEAPILLKNTLELF